MYTVIKSHEQYIEYCKIIDDYMDQEGNEPPDHIELLTFLIEKYQDENSTFILPPIFSFTHILQTIQLIRDSFTGSEKVYTQGSCVKFAMILKHIYPQGNILYHSSHAIFEYDGKSYDINGLAEKHNHIPIEDYGILKSYEIMQLKFDALKHM